MTPDYPTWRADRLRELDLIDAQIDELPTRIGRKVREYTRFIRAELQLGHARTRTENDITQLAAELARITVTPASDGGEGKS